MDSKPAYMKEKQEPIDNEKYQQLHNRFVPKKEKQTMEFLLAPPVLKKPIDDDDFEII
jgi:hypothetical protein